MKKIEFRRKKEGKTNYPQRLKLLLGDKPRLIIRVSLKNIIVEIVEYKTEGDKILAFASSKELEKNFGWKFSRKNIPASYLTGYLLGKKATKLNIKEAILDIGLKSSNKGNKIYSALKGVLDAGLDVPCSKDILPSEDVIKGLVISKYAQKLTKEGKYDKIYSDYTKKGIKAEDLPKHFEEIKKKID